MGLFSRKSSKNINTNGDLTPSNGTGLNSNANSLKSPPPTKTSHGESFISPSALDVSLPAPPDPTLDPAAYLRSIYAVRARCGLIYQRAKRNQLAHFDVDGGKFGETAAYLVSIIKVAASVRYLLSYKLTTFTAEGLRAKLQTDTCSRTMAALRSRRTTKDRAITIFLAVLRRRTRTHPPLDRSLPRLSPPRCWRRNKMVLQIEGVGQGLQTQ